MVNRHERRKEEKLSKTARDCVLRERRFHDKDTNSYYRTVVELTVTGEMGISLYKNGLLVAEEADD